MFKEKRRRKSKLLAYKLVNIVKYVIIYMIERARDVREQLLFRT